MEKKTWPIKELVIAYLAISKVINWSDKISDLNQGGWEEIGIAILNRLLEQDIMIILLILAMLVLDRKIEKAHSKKSSVVKMLKLHCFGALVVVAVLFTYFSSLNWIFAGGNFNFAEYSRGFIRYIPFTLGIYVASIIIIEVKQYIKMKSSSSLEGKLESLDILLKDKVLSQEEYDCAKKRLYD